MCVLLGIFREFPVDPYYEPLAWFMILVSTFLGSSISLVDGASVIEKDGWCNGSVTGTIVYGDGEVVKFVGKNGKDLVFTVVTRFHFANYFPVLSTVPYAGENGITIKHDGHYLFLFPGGYSGQRVLHVFNYSDNSSSTIEVYCLPISLAYKPGQETVNSTIVGHCRSLNVFASARVSGYRYFKLGVRNGKWMDISRAELRGLYNLIYTVSDVGEDCAKTSSDIWDGLYYCAGSHIQSKYMRDLYVACEPQINYAYETNCPRCSLVNWNNTNPAVILQYHNHFGTKLYFANKEKLDQIDLDNLVVDTYYLPEPEGCNIHHIVPTPDKSFSGLRVIFSNGYHSGYYHLLLRNKLYSFTGIPAAVHTDYVAFDSYNLSYLITFANLNTLKVIEQDGTSKQFLLSCPLDDPIQCQNMATEPNIHYLICLAGNGLHPLIINITTEQVTSKIIPVNSQIVRVELLTGDVFYLLIEKAEMLFYVAGSTIVYLGHYTLRQDINFVISSATTDIVCSNITDDENLLWPFIIFVIMLMVYKASTRQLPV